MNAVREALGGKVLEKALAPPFIFCGEKLNAV